MKAIMLSVRPEWAEKILNGEKTIEIRKSVPKDFNGWVYIYCTKDKSPYLHRRYTENTMPHINYVFWDNIATDHILLNGKVVAKFTLNKVEEVLTQHHIDAEQYDRVVKGSCIDYELFEKYVGEKEQVYAWHIDNIVIFDTPKGLNEFGRRYAPQSWCYVEVKEVIENDN